MWDTSERLLKLLSMLQRQREWSASALCKELSVTPRTITRDVSRLRSLGYPVTTRKGQGGGYALEAGAVLPPIMFDVEEAAAVLLALQVHPGMGNETSANASSAMEKLQKVLAKPVQAAAKALAAHTSSIDLGIPIGTGWPDTPTATLLLLSRGCRDRRQLGCTYRHHSGESSPRILEPLHLIQTMNRWYLVAYCTNDLAWSVFRVDRITEARLLTHRSHARQPPSDDLAEYVSQAVARGWQQVTAIVRIHAPKQDVAHWISPAWGTVTEETSGTCIVKAGSDSYDSMARWLLLAKAELTVISPPELSASFRDVAQQSRRAGNLG